MVTAAQSNHSLSSKMVWKPSKLQSHKIEDLWLCLMLNSTSPCTNPLSQFHSMLLIVVARFISAILILVYPVIIRKYNEVNHRDRAQMNINPDNTMTSVSTPSYLDRLWPYNWGAKSKLTITCIWRFSEIIGSGAPLNIPWSLLQPSHSSANVRRA
jgi:hypothetical protein